MKTEPSGVRKTFALGATVMSMLFLLPVSSRAQFAIGWHSVDGGGVTSTGGVFSVSGTIGQPDAGTLLAGGGYSLAGGFWSVVEMPGAPSLTITLNGTRAVISWPSASAGFTLQQNANASSAGWVVALGAVNDNGTNKFIFVNPPMGNRFYRLFKP